MTDRASLMDETLKSLAVRLFGVAQIRPLQRASLTATMSGQDALTVLPTGGGKSLCYQLAAVGLREQGRGAALVVSPLLALIADQVESLVQRGIGAAALTGETSVADADRCVDKLQGGLLDLLYVTPERAVSPQFLEVLSDTDISLVAIDEAHCISQWGHDFRPEYRKLSILKTLPSRPIFLALTATATPKTQADIIKNLAMKKPQISVGDFYRRNLRINVVRYKGMQDRLTELARLVRAHLHGTEPGRCLIYTQTRKLAEKAAAFLRARQLACDFYHAGRTSVERAQVQKEFAQSQSGVLVATNAFGMGIDHANIYCLIHLQAPSSLEAYYQEIGRAGRDERPAVCSLMYGAADFVLHRRMNSPLKKRGIEEPLDNIEHFFRLTSCRWASIVRYFAPTAARFACGHCDVCEGTSTAADGAQDPLSGRILARDVQDVLFLAASALTRPIGRVLLARLVKGRQDRKLLKLKLDRHPYYRALAQHTERDLTATLDAMLAEGRLARRGRKYPTLWPAGRPVKTKKASAKSRTSAQKLEQSLANYARREARRLGWAKPYLVMTKKVIAHLAQKRPQTEAELLGTPGLGRKKVERFGADLLVLLRTSDR